jgi:hypothetical protein
MRASVEGMMGTLSKANPATAEAVQLVVADENSSGKKSGQKTPEQRASSKMGRPGSKSGDWAAAGAGKVAVVCTNV